MPNKLHLVVLKSAGHGEIRRVFVNHLGTEFLWSLEIMENVFVVLSNLGSEQVRMGLYRCFSEAKDDVFDSLGTSSEKKLEEHAGDFEITEIFVCDFSSFSHDLRDGSAVRLLDKMVERSKNVDSA